MPYQWWVFIHLAGVFGFLAAHGVSMSVAFRLRKEREPARINALLELSSRSITPFYISFGLLLAGGIGATFSGDLWGFGWIWAAIGTLVVVVLAMYGMATNYYKRVRFIAAAMAEGTEAVTDEQFDEVLRGPRPLVIAGIGLVGLGFILYLMIFKPTLGLAPSAEAAPPPPEAGPTITIDAVNVLFTTDRLEAPADEPFVIAFDNRDSGVPHNVAIYRDDSAEDELFVGEIFPGPAERNYEVEALPTGSYFFQCDVHPTTMIGTIEVG